MQAKDSILVTIEGLSKKYNFTWKNLYKLSSAELHFLMSVLSSGYIHGKCFERTMPDVAEREKVVQDVLLAVTDDTFLDLKYGIEAEAQDGR